MIRAAVDHSYFRKFLFVFLGCCAYSGWCLYDGLIGYPYKLQIAEAYEAIPKEQRREKWPEVAKENGWPAATPQKKAEAISHGIGQQWFMIILCMIFGIPALLKWMSGQGTFVEGDENLIRHSKGAEVPIDAITKIDKKKWKEKGIAKIHYDVGGKTKTFVMDDFKYDRKPMGELLAIAEANLSDEQIVGGKREGDEGKASDSDQNVDSDDGGANATSEVGGTAENQSAENQSASEE